MISDQDIIPEAIIKAAESAAFETLPALSKARYLKAYDAFEAWKKFNNVQGCSEQLLMAYFYEMSKIKKPTTLWATYSMLKSTIKVKKNLNMSDFHQLSAFLKNNASGYIPKKSDVFLESEIDQFLSEASDREWLDVKVAMIFGLCGCLRCDELVKITIDIIEQHNSMLLVRVPICKTKKAFSFTISGTFYEIVQRYAKLRVPTTQNNRFFVNYQHGKCTVQVIGYRKLSLMPRRVAEFLQLPDPQQYTGHCLRRSSATILANTGASIETIKRHGNWRTSTVAEGYIEESLGYKQRTESLISNSINGSRRTHSSNHTGCTAQSCISTFTQSISSVHANTGVGSQGFIQTEDDCISDDLLSSLPTVALASGPFDEALSLVDVNRDDNSNQGQSCSKVCDEKGNNSGPLDLWNKFNFDSCEVHFHMK